MSTPPPATLKSKLLNKWDRPAKISCRSICVETPYFSVAYRVSYDIMKLLQIYKDGVPMITHADGKVICEKREDLMPVRILASEGVSSRECLLETKAPCVSFKKDGCAVFSGKGSYVLLDFGREICGSARIVIRAIDTSDKQAKWRITFGESVSEACSTIGSKNAGNDHSPRDFEILTPFMSDLTFGQSGFRFLRLELLTEATVLMRNIFAVSIEPDFTAGSASITTDDQRLNEIIHTAARTVKLCFQNGYIWDGIKRDRLVWCGDLHPEILTSLYLFGDTPNIRNSLDFLRDETPADQWINNMPPYSAWWVINLCDYCRITANHEYYHQNREYALAVMAHINRCFDDDGNYNFSKTNGSETFLDWSTYQTPDAPFGAAAVYCFAAQKVLKQEENADCRDILRKLAKYFDYDGHRKPVRAFQIIAGRSNPDDLTMLEKDGPADFSTFMAYYILTAMAKNGGKNMLEILKTYYGAMLDCGATTFWEDFDMSWLEESSRIDAMPEPGQKDIHGDYGRFCYTQFRHSLCHGWSAGVLAFIIEYIFGIRIEGQDIYIHPHYMGLKDISVILPLSDSASLAYEYSDGKLFVDAPDDYTVHYL